MNRPDESKFLQHTEHFLVIDGELETFARKHGFSLDKNLYRTPCRVLRKAGNPELIIDIYQEGIWYDTTYSDDLPHSFTVAAYYEASSNDSFLYKLEEIIAEHESFDKIANNLGNYLIKAVEVLNSWTQSDFRERGNHIENFRKRFS